MTHLFKSAIFLALASVLLYGCKTETHSQKNIIFFLVDDMGYSDVGCFGSDYYETPRIDQLADEGMTFTSAYAASTVCSPTRASIMTGKYPGRLHITHAIPIKGYARIKGGTGTPLKDADYTMNLPLEEVTIAEALHEAGYATASIGKWHICDEPDYYPEYQGFDINIGGNHRGNTGEYFYPYYGKWRMAKGHPLIEWNTLPDGKPGEYLTDRLTEEAASFIEENKDQPFFLYMSHYAVHTPIEPEEKLLSKYEEKQVDSIKGHIKPAYAAMVESVDQSLDLLMKKLDELNLTENTIIIFTSDNGGHGKWTSNYPWRGNKGNFYEGGIRVPLIVKWPGVTTPASVSDVPVISNDYYPTMLEMVGLPLRPEQHMDGLSFVPLLTGDGKLDRETLFWHFPNYIGAGHPNPSRPLSVIRKGEWKLIESLEDGSVELYNLINDPGETMNVSLENPQLADKLKEQLELWRKEADVQMPEPNPDYNPE